MSQVSNFELTEGMIEQFYREGFFMLRGLSPKRP